MRKPKRVWLCSFGALGVLLGASAAAWACAQSGAAFLAVPDPQRAPVGSTIDVTGAQWAAAPVDLHYYAGQVDLGHVTVMPRSSDGAIGARLRVPNQPGTYNVTGVQGDYRTAQSFEVIDPNAVVGGNGGTGGNGTALTSMSVSGRMASGPQLVANLPLPTRAGGTAATPVAATSAPVAEVAPASADNAVLADVTAAPAAGSTGAAVDSSPATPATPADLAATPAPAPVSAGSVTGDLWAPLKPQSVVPGLADGALTSQSANPAAIGGWLAVGLVPLMGGFAALELRRRRVLAAVAAEVR